MPQPCTKLKHGQKEWPQREMVWGPNLDDTVNSFTGDAKSLVEALTDAVQLVDTMLQTKTEGWA
jgi:hypothetical protein